MAVGEKIRRTQSLPYLPRHKHCYSKKEIGFPELTWTQCVKKRNHPSQKQFMDRTWERAKKVIAGLLKLGSNPAMVQAGDKYEAGLVERIAFLDRDKITAKESTSLDLWRPCMGGVS